MIHVFFVPGMFGTSIEYVLRTFSQEHNSINASILPDGSMHSFEKQCHWLSVKDIQATYSDVKLKATAISTPIYPYEDHHLPEILELLVSFIESTDKKILIYSDTVGAAEMNMLFQYHKISVGRLNMGLGIYFNKVAPEYTRWCSTYTSWQDMQPWELREWLSIFYPAWIQEWIVSKDQVDDTFLTMSNREILENPRQSFERMIEHCNLTLDSTGLDQFVDKWCAAQQYIVGEYNLLIKIVNNTLLGQSISWEPLNLVAEAIVQQHIRASGYEIRCDGLNTFPTDSKTLYNLLEKV